MQKMILGAIVGCGMVLNVVAADDAALASVCQRLEAALEAQVEALSDVQDAASAAEALPAIRQSLADQKALFGVDERELWNYIDHTDEVKIPLMRVLQRMAAQIDRIEKENYYGCSELKKLLF